MKKVIKICTLVLALVLLASLTVMFVSADSDCEVAERNIANLATVTTMTEADGASEPAWPVTDHLSNLNDGDKTTGAINHHGRNDFGFWFTFDDTYNFTKIVITTYGAGRAESSWGASTFSSGNFVQYDIDVYLYDEAGKEIFHQTCTTSKDGIVIELDEDIGRAAKMKFHCHSGSGWGKAVWEVETYTKEAHSWQDLSETVSASCTESGIKTVQCAVCGEEKSSIIPATGHYTTVPCSLDCSGCGMIGVLNATHERDPLDPCSGKCGKCGATDAFTPGHTKDFKDPCSTTCFVCKEEGTIIPEHIASATDPCSSACGKCGETGVITPVHVASTTDLCSKSCAKCSAPDVITPAHVIPDGADPCQAVTCATEGCGVSIPARHVVKPCSRSCAKCGKGYVFSVFGHSYTNCGDTQCNYGTHAGGRDITEKDVIHTFTPDSPYICVTCNLWSYDACVQDGGHQYGTGCDIIKCKRCGYKHGKSWRDGAGSIPDYWHIFSNACDNTCETCGFVRLSEAEKPTTDGTNPWPSALSNDYYIGGYDPDHNFLEHACATLCQTCGYERTNTADHTYSNLLDSNNVEMENSSVCDPQCDLCGETREVTHTYLYACAQKCLYCKSDNVNAINLHTWDNVCDTTCNTNGCVYRRTVPHVFSYECDANCDTEGCTGTRAITHSYSSACDASCNKTGCTFVRTVDDDPTFNPTHTYSSDCDDTCNIQNCGYVRTAETDNTLVVGHKYDNNCDATCNVAKCGNIRTTQTDERYDPDHHYDNQCDTECNYCGATRTVPAHQYGPWATSTPAQPGVKGEEKRECAYCGSPETRELPALPVEEPDEGLSAGAIVGIVLGSVGVVGGGGFCLWWFVIRKKLLGA